MTPSRKSLIGAGLLACAAMGAFAQTPPASPPAVAPQATSHSGHAHPSREDMMQRMQAGHARRMERLKTILQLTPAQQGVWDSFAAAMQPPAPPAASGADPRARWEEFSKMTTPQRLDRMQQRMAERDAMFSKRADATRTFYAALSPAQQKAFDVESLPHFGKHGPRGPGGPEGFGGPGGPGGRHMPPPPAHG